MTAMTAITAKTTAARRAHILIPLSVVSLLATAATAQPRFLLVDRTNDTIWVARDRDNSGTVDADELGVWFDAANAEFTPGLMTPGAIAVRRNGSTIVGDSDTGRRAVYALRDANADIDAQDVGESIQAADPFNADLVSFGAPQGAAFNASGHAFIANASNTGGLDAIYRLVDLDNDGLFMSLGEITEYVGAPAFGSSSSGSFNPAEIVFIGNVGYLRNSGAGFHGIYRFEDADGSGRADDMDEFTGFWDSTADNLSGLLPGAGLTLEVDNARPRSLYTLQVATGGVDMLIRVSDSDASGAAHQPEEAVVVYSSAASGFSATDILSLRDGRVLLTDSSGDRVLVLTDVDGDDEFNTEGEAVDLLAGFESIGTIRQIALLPCPGDWNLDLAVNSSDISAYLTGWLASVTAPNVAADFNADSVTNSSDISAFLSAWLVGVQGGC